METEKPPSAQEAHVYISCSGVQRESLVFPHLMPWIFAKQKRLLYLETKTAFTRIFISSTTESQFSGIFLLHTFVPLEDFLQRQA